VLACISSPRLVCEGWDGAMIKAKTEDSLLGGGGIMAGIFGVLSLAAYAVPATGIAHHLKEATNLYLHHVRNPVLQAFGWGGATSLAWIDLAVLI
jgi:hypothetical protein